MIYVHFRQVIRETFQKRVLKRFLQEFDIVEKVIFYGKLTRKVFVT